MSKPIEEQYVLGHSESELVRLERQARIMEPITRRFFEAAGVGPGMRVLDCGSGAGDVAFLAADLDCGTASSCPPAQTHDRLWKWWMALLPHTGADPRMGLHLYATFVSAGLPEPTLRQESILVGGASAAEYLRRGVAAIVAGAVGDMERHGIATAADIDYPTVADRMLAEVIANDSMIVGRAEGGAWART